jgi:glutaconate CoA-transferase subunit A
MGLRFLAGAMGLPFMTTKSLIGSSIEKYNDMIKVIEDPYEGQRVAVVPAATPDVAIVHVNRADMRGNAQYLGFSSNAENIARAAKRTIITCEEIISTDKIKENPTFTTVPQYVVDAVVEVPYCSHPWNMAYAYAYDIPFHMEMMAQIETEEAFTGREKVLQMQLLVLCQQSYDMLQGVVTPTRKPGSSVFNQLKRLWIPALLSAEDAGMTGYRSLPIGT